MSKLLETFSRDCRSHQEDSCECGRQSEAEGLGGHDVGEEEAAGGG